MEEVRKAIRKVKRVEASGHDNMTSEMLKFLGTNRTAMLTIPINKIADKNGKAKMGLKNPS